MCCEEGCLDTCCCSLAAKALFFGVWTLGIGILFLCGAVLRYTCFADESDSDFLKILSLVLCCVHIIGGVCLLFGFFKSAAKIFLSGIVLSSFLPYFNFIWIFLPIVQVIFTITSCRYYKQTLKNPN